MSNMSRHAFAAVDNPPVRNNATTYSGTHRHIYKVVAMLGRSEAPFADCRGNAVVGERHIAAKQFVELEADRKINETRQCRNAQCDAGLGVKGARTCDADSLCLGHVVDTGNPHRCFMELCQNGERALVHRRRHGDTLENFARRAHQRGANLRSSQIDADGEILGHAVFRDRAANASFVQGRPRRIPGTRAPPFPRRSLASRALYSREFRRRPRAQSAAHRTGIG